MRHIRALATATLIASCGTVTANASARASDAIVPFRINVPDATLKDLKERLARTRFPSEIEQSGWDYGTNLAYLKELVTYWQTTFNWREQERRLNQLPQFTTTIDGVDIHFVHQRSSHPNATPLVMIHGWPGSFFEFTKVIGPLTEPTKFGGNASDAFHVVALSLPGYGFSGKPRTGGYSPTRMARIVAQLMARLGYTRYGAQGGDWGAAIVRQLGLVDREHLIGLHSNMCLANAPPGPNPNEGVPATELKRVQAAQARSATELGYFQIQSTQTDDARLRLERLAGRTRGVDRREVSRLVGFRWGRREEIHEGRAADERHDLLGDRERAVIGASLLREPGGHRSAGPSRGPVRVRALSARDVRDRADEVDRGAVQPAAVDRHAARRPLRGDGGAAAPR